MRAPPLVLPLAASTLIAAAAPATTSAADLTVEVVLPRISTGSYHRPYVAVWIETPDQDAVRTLAVWYQQTRNAEGDGKDWLKDMRTWWRKSGRATTLPADGVSGATRAPGRHTLRIPGARLRDLTPGAYVIVVEAAREHGGREVVRTPFRWGAPNRGEATGAAEIGAVAVVVSR